jgi:ParB family transcriptional regulator, chromosome partitioning protein
MSRADQFARTFNENMSESLGVRRPPANDQTERALGGAIARESPDEGKLRDRQAGRLELSRIVPDPDQPRKTFPEDSLQQLAVSLKTTGQLQPIRVRWSQGHGKWIIVSGERRFRAACLAGLETIACQFIERPLSEVEIRQQSLIENLLREDLMPLEAARGYEQLMEQSGWSVREVAEALNISPGTVSKALALLRLPTDLQNLVSEGSLSASAAYEVSRLDGEEPQRELAHRVLNEGLRRDDAGREVGKTARPRKGKGRAPSPVTSKSLAVSGAKITITWPRESVTREEVIVALNEALELVAREAG